MNAAILQLSCLLVSAVGVSRLNSLNGFMMILNIRAASIVIFVFSDDFVDDICCCRASSSSLLAVQEVTL